MNSLSLPRINYQFTIFSWFHYELTFCFANTLWIHLVFCKYTMNSPSFLRIYNEFTVFIKNLVRIHLNFPKTHYEFTIFIADSLSNREFIMNLVSVPRIQLISPIYHEINFVFANSLSVPRIHYEYTINLSISRKNHELTICFAITL